MGEKPEKSVRQETHLPKVSEIVLGYHSPTEWVFLPEVTGLYNSVVINADVYHKTVEGGKKSRSGYQHCKAVLLESLCERSVLQPKEYSVAEDDRRKLEHLLDHFFLTYPEAIKKLAIRAFESFISHEMGTLENLISVDDPHWADANSQIPRLRKFLEAIKTCSSIANVPRLKDVLRGYFEDCLFTPLLFPKCYNPVFQWEGYAPFEGWLLHLRQDQQSAEERIKKGTSFKVMRGLTEILVPFRPIRSEKESARVLSKWDQFADIRALVARLNEEVWTGIEKAQTLEDSELPEFVRDFESSLGARVRNINGCIRERDEEIEKTKSSIFHKIVRAAIATLGSILPGTGGIAQLLDDLYQGQVARNAGKEYPNLRGVFEYERLLSSLSLSRGPLPPVCSIGTQYDLISYWDQHAR